jgi:hypothetical protein
MHSTGQQPIFGSRHQGPRLDRSLTGRARPHQALQLRVPLQLLREGDKLAADLALRIPFVRRAGTVRVGSFANFGPNFWPINPDTGVTWAAGQLVYSGIESLA